ncbi:unnamed protein product, partial [marine sediment metagenome]
KHQLFLIYRLKAAKQEKKANKRKGETWLPEKQG